MIKELSSQSLAPPLQQIHPYGPPAAAPFRATLQAVQQTQTQEGARQDDYSNEVMTFVVMEPTHDFVFVCARAK